MTPPVDPQPGPDFEKVRASLSLPMDHRGHPMHHYEVLAEEHGQFIGLLTASDDIVQLLYALESTASALLRAAETERELRKELDEAKHEIQECVRFAAIFGPGGSPPPLFGAMRVQWAFQQQATVLEELHVSLVLAAKDTARLNWLEAKRTIRTPPSSWQVGFYGHGFALREAIDAARHNGQLTDEEIAALRPLAQV